MPDISRPSVRSRFASATLEFHDADAGAGQPLVDARVRVDLLDSNGNPSGPLFQGRTNAEGKVSIRIPVPPAITGEPAKPLPRIRIRVLDLDGDELKRQDVQPEADKPIPLIKVSDEPQRQKLHAALGDGSLVLGRPISRTLAERLAQHKVDSLASLRGTDPVAFAGLSDDDRQDLADLNAHAQLQVASRDHKTNQALVKAGYRAMLDISRQSRSDFMAKVKGHVPDSIAKRLYATARLQEQVLGAIHTERAANAANGIAYGPSAAGSTADEPPCECKCGSAVSPQAYLVDLLDYAVDNVRFSGSGMDLPKIDNTFGQPFGALPVDCAFAALLVPQVRLCVEVLHRRAAQGAVSSALEAHASRAYAALLGALGTSHKELRLARADAGAKQRLADKLGMPPELVDRLRLEAGGSGDQALTEDNIERLFGLQATARDPLSTGAKFNDGQGQITRWLLRGVEWRKNTDDLGRIHVSIVKRASGKHEVIAFENQSRGVSSRTGMGSSSAASDEIELAPENTSGLAARIGFTYAANDTDIYLAVVPEYTVHRKARLRTFWRQADHPPRAFDMPIVDPDLVTESDLMRPFAANTGHALWQDRKTFLQTKRNALNKDAQDRSRTLQEMLEDMLGGPQDRAAWNAIAIKLESAAAADVTAGETELRALDPLLTPETFRFLLELWRRESAGQEIKVAEREQALDVLVNIHKRRQFSNWKTQEANQNLRLSAPFFILSDVERTLNPLRVTAAVYDEWRTELERNSVAPLVDPDIISESNFVPGAGSAVAYAIWERRRQLIGDGRRAGDNVSPRVEGTLFQTVASVTSVAKLDAVLTSGDLPAGQQPPLFHRLGFTASELQGIDEALKRRLILPVMPEQFGLTTGELRALFEVRSLDVSADDSDWEQVHHILIQAEKRRYLYPQWRIEERDSDIALSPDVFLVPGPALAELLPVRRLAPGFLRWRSDVRRQRDWTQQLNARIEQEHAVDVELQTAIDAAEEASLPMLRDDLVMATVSAGQGGESLEERKRWVTNHLLINAFENGCRKTTRVAQAIEAIQLLLWGIYSGQFEDNRFSLEAASAETFADEWIWLGSYATWRSAMFTYLYPENLLLPELRREIGDPDSDPTKLFRAMLKVISGTAPPPSAQGAGNEGSDETQPAEDDELVPFIDAIYRRLDTDDLQTLKGQKTIFANLTGFRLMSPPGQNDSDAVILRDSRGFFILEPNKPAGSETNPYYFVRLLVDFEVTAWHRYRIESAFLEDVLYIPVTFALNQLRRGKFEEALYWFRTVFDYTSAPEPGKQGWTNPRLELYFQQRSATDIPDYPALDQWLSDVLNPHRIAATRVRADARFVVLSVIRCLLDYGDSEFSRDSSESLARARELYETARRLLDSGHLGTRLGDCQDVIGALVSEIGEDVWVEIVLPELRVLEPPGVDTDTLRAGAREQLVDEIKGVLKPTNPPKPRAAARREVHSIFAKYFVPKTPETLEQARVVGNAASRAAYHRTLAEPKVFLRVQRLGAVGPTTSPLFMSAGLGRRGKDFEREHGHWKRAPRFEFCVPRNPLIAMLRLRYEVSWFKLNNCMNLAGQHREVPVYAAPTDTYSGLPVADVAGPAAIAAASRFLPTLYRYRVLVERARQLVAMAQQMEANYLSFLEKRDQEAYSILRARQDLGIANANVKLQDLRVTEANDGKDLAGSQWERANGAFNYYEKLVDEGLSGLEESALNLLIVNAFLQGAVALATTGGAVVAGLVAGGVIGAETGPGAFFTSLGGGGGALAAAMGLSQTAFSATTGALATASSIFSMQASFERRRQEWEFQRDLASIDVAIAVAQQTLAEDRYDIVVQERRISEMSAENASDVVNFLNTKFTNAELYAWMGGIVGGIYRYLLQEATTIAKLAQRQLAFERQESELAIVLDDYWTYTDTSALLRGGGDPTERRGMTGSARLLQDTTRLDQEAFLTDRRKLQLSKTLSLALHDPVAFARFRETGVLRFMPTLDLFDRDFPGHYLRLIKRVRMSVIALVPPTEGIRATLSSAGISRVVRGGDTFAETEIRREPETVALTSPLNATGMFELQEQSEMLLPFEGSGVAASWEFSMPRAANVVNYETIADVLMTIEYTALDSPMYRQQVTARMDRSISGERPFTFRQQFADAWYDFHHADLVQEPQKPMVVTFTTRREDFPPNVDELKIEHVSLLFGRKPEAVVEVNVAHLRFTEDGRAGAVGGAATSVNGLVSTRGSNAGSWLAMIGKSPVGSWELALPDDSVTRALFTDGDLTDILFVVTFGGMAPAWPA